MKNHERWSYERWGTAVLQRHIVAVWTRLRESTDINAYDFCRNSTILCAEDCRCIANIYSFLSNSQFELADAESMKCVALAPETYQRLRLSFSRDSQNRVHKVRIQQLLKQEDFVEADGEHSRRGLLSGAEYLELKSPHVQVALQGVVVPNISIEQSKALATLATNQLVTARAGSGKTATLVAKVVHLCRHYGVEPNEILVLAFNRAAAREIRDRIAEILHEDDFPCAMTFHSLAHRIVKPNERLLVDSPEQNRETQTAFVNRLINDLWNPAFRKQLYLHFREELRELEAHGHNLSRQDYLTYRKNVRQLSLKGEPVKSLGEKYIADFLCEHGIRYVYEKDIWYKGAHGSSVVRPDFALLDCGRDIVIEHWGVDEQVRSEMPAWWDGTWDEYVARMRFKREFYRGKEILLLETSICEIRNGRGAFERSLRAKLEDIGVRCSRLDEETLIEEIVDPKKTKISKMFLQFINNTKKRKLSPDKLSALAKSEVRERVRVFHELAIKVYAEYQKQLLAGKLIDFDDLLLRSAEVVRKEHGNVTLTGKGGWTANLSQLKWICIDEYQDFSPLFFGLVSAIRENNPDCRLFCVGDDWQAINGFAGSELRFFTPSVPIIVRQRISVAPRVGSGEFDV